MRLNSKKTFTSLSRDDYYESMNYLKSSYYELDTVTIKLLCRLKEYVKNGEGISELVRDILQDMITEDRLEDEK